MEKEYDPLKDDFERWRDEFYRPAEIPGNIPPISDKSLEVFSEATESVLGIMLGMSEEIGKLRKEFGDDK